MFHFNVQNLLGPIFLGLLFGYLVVETNSLFAGIMGHIVNNGTAVVVAFVFNLLQGFITESGLQEAAQEPHFNDPKMLIGALLFFIVLAVIPGVIGAFLLKWLKKDIAREKSLKQDEMSLEPELIEAETPPHALKGWYQQYHNLPIAGVAMLYIYYLIRHMSI